MNESCVEEATLAWFGELGYAVLHGPDIAPGEPASERSGYGDVVLVERLRAALGRCNPTLPQTTLDEALRRVMRTDTSTLLENNRRFHQMLTDGIAVEYQATDGRTVYEQAQLIDFSYPDNNDWLVVNQFTILENRRNRRPDVLVFLNGLPVAVLELKNPGDENATLSGAYNQLQTYKQEIPSLFTYNECLVISDGVEARTGTLTADIERFMPWRTVDGREVAPRNHLELEVLVKGVFEKQRLLDLLRYFIVFEVDGARISKKIAGYHQFHAVNKAVDCTVQASSPNGTGRVGVVWHTQGSGKSLTMAFYAGKIIQHPALANPTLIVLTDRNDLDNQLFGTFSLCSALLRQAPRQAESREQLRELLAVASGGVVFTTIQKFMPERGESYPLLSDRRNIIVIADEAHRSQYDFIDGFARHLRDGLPNASSIAFTGTPVEAADRNTQAVFGNYIDVYDIQRAVEDGATVRIYYEARLAKLTLKAEEQPTIDAEFEEVTEGEEGQAREKLKTKWARQEAMVGTEKRVALVAQDVVDHFENRLSILEGKGMIVAMSRRICTDLYDAVIKLRPDWHSGEDDKGVIKVVMTGSASDKAGMQPHIRNKARREAIAKRLKDPEDPLKLVIVRDMWLTGFDAPCLHTMYVDKPMQGHGLMQAIARVNRVFKDKPGGLIVDYLGLAIQLKKALAEYTDSGGKGETTIDQDQAVDLMLEKYEVVTGILFGFDYSAAFSPLPAERLRVIPLALDFIVAEEDRKKRFLQAVLELSKAFALAVPDEEALAIRDEVGFFQALRGRLTKFTITGEQEKDNLDSAIRQLISKAVTTDEVIDIFAEAGLKNPDISILSDEFLAEVRELPQRNLALELLKKLLNDEIKTRSRKNVVQARSFSEMLQRSILSYQNRSIEAAQVIAELIDLARHIRAANQRGEQLGLTDDELAFYDALEVNDSAVKVLGDATLRAIARELVDIVRSNVTIDWTVKESV